MTSHFSSLFACTIQSIKGFKFHSLLKKKYIFFYTASPAFYDPHQAHPSYFMGPSWSQFTGWLTFIWNRHHPVIIIIIITVIISTIITILIINVLCIVIFIIIIISRSSSITITIIIIIITVIIIIIIFPTIITTIIITIVIFIIITIIVIIIVNVIIIFIIITMLNAIVIPTSFLSPFPSEESVSFGSCDFSNTPSSPSPRLLRVHVMEITGATPFCPCNNVVDRRVDRFSREFKQ